MLKDMFELRWHGPIYGQSGYEVITRGMLLALDGLGVKIQVDPAREWNVEKINLPSNHVNRLIRMTETKVSTSAPLIMHQKFQNDYANYPGAKYIYSLFETDLVPEPWREGFMKVNAVFTFSDWLRDLWVKDGIPESKVITLPFGVDADIFDPKKVKPANIVNAKKFVFLANGDFVERKNFDLLIEAFCKEFKPKEDVCLIIKSHSMGFTKMHKDRVEGMLRDMARRWTPRPPKILFFGDKIAEEEVPKLYASAHCFVLPSRGEGLGLPYIEAMASGLPVIATDWGAQQNYIKDGVNGMLIPNKINLIRDVEYIKKCPHAVGHSWADADLKTLQEKMRWVFEYRAEAFEMGRRARESMLCMHWHHTALKILRTLFKPVEEYQFKKAELEGSAK